MSELPKGWLKTEIGMVTTVVAGGTPKASDKSNFAEPGEGIAWLTPADLSKYNKKSISHGSRDLSKQGLKSSSAKLMPKGTILFSSRAPIGYSVIAENEIATNQGFKNFVLPEGVDSSYTYYYLKSIKHVAESMGTGTTFKELSGAVAKTLPFVLAPTNEQIRIANKLDSILTKVDAGQARLDKIPNILKRFRQSVLAAATSGELTKNWVSNSDEYYSDIDIEIKNDKKLNKLSKVTEQELELTKSLFGTLNWSRWKTYPLEMLVDSTRGIPYGIVQTGDALDVGIPTIRCGDVKPLKILMKALKKVSSEIESKYIRTRLRGGEVLLAIRGTVGHAAVATQKLVDLKANISREVAMIPVRDNIDSSYIAMLLQSPGGYRCLAEKVRGVAQKGINLTDVKRFVTPLPSLDEQKQIVRRVEALFTMADNVEKQYKDAKARTNRLTQSVLSKAFRGELVPQDPNDEPASKLLEKIKQKHLKENAVKVKKKLSAKPQKSVKTPKAESKKVFVKDELSAVVEVDFTDEQIRRNWLGTDALYAERAIQNLKETTFTIDQFQSVTSFSKTYEELRDLMLSLVKGMPGLNEPLFEIAGWDKNTGEYNFKLKD